MKNEIWTNMSPLQREIMFISMVVRNRLEDFHCEHLDDGQMKTLNKTIREGLMEGALLYDKGLSAAEKQLDGKELDFEEKYWLECFGFTAHMVPDYWEIPSEEEIESEMNADFENSKKLHDELQKERENEDPLPPR